MLRLLPLLLVLFVVQDRDPDLDRNVKEGARIAVWAEPIAAMLTTLLPGRFETLEDWAPWDVQNQATPAWGCPIACTVFAQVNVQRSYVIGEPALIAKVEATEQKLIAKVQQVIANPTDEKLHAAQKTLEADIESLKRSPRRIALAFRVNGSVGDSRGREAAATKAGTIAGYSVYRFAFVDPNYEPTPAAVRLAVIVGPEGFKTQKVTGVAPMTTEIRTVVAHASVQSRTATVKDDEALARRLLEKIDYAELAKLLK